MSDVVVCAEHLFKEYQMGGTNHQSLQKDVQSFFARLRGKDDPNSLIGSDPGASTGTFLALNDVSFTLSRGEALGIMGCNGAGKTTLLKIISRVVRPDTGCVRIRGRVSSLLEVGTGFHPDLTGRDNVFMNGSILGISNREIVSKFDEIVAFSEIEPFIDMPVKRYSSGMRMRLAFSIAAHLLAEIVILDEVLAVGDIFFQKKCQERMEHLLRNEGRTLILVSHSPTTLQRLCNKGLFLNKGEVVVEGLLEDALAAYVHSRTDSSKQVA